MTAENEHQFPALAAVYPKLRHIAARLRRGEAPDFTLGATEIVHEVLLRLSDSERATWNGPEHFYLVAARGIRRVIVDHARRRQAVKRGSNAARVEFDDVAATPVPRAKSLVLLDELLDELSLADERKSRVVQLRVFCGLTMDEIAETLAVSKPTVEREWRIAQSWLRARFRDD